MTDSAQRYSTQGLLGDLRVGMTFATALAVLALLLFALAALVNLAAALGHGTPAMPWSALGVLVVAVPASYYLGALSGSLLAFSARPLRRGRFGSALVGFIGGFCGMGSMLVAIKMFPVQFEYMSRHPSPTPPPVPTAFVVFMAFIGGVIGVLVGLNVYRKSKPRAVRRDAP